MVWLQLATKNHTAALSLPPPPSGMGRRISRKKAKFVVWDENSFTEWQREKTTISNTDKKNIQDTVFSPPNAQLAPE